MAKITIVVPIYNAEKYLQQCLDSIVKQTLKDIEIILVDDGSTDNSAQICQQYLKDSRVKYFHKENQGLAAARHDGINMATGEYVGFVDSDDWLELNMYERMYSAAQENNADIVFCNCVQNENGHHFTPEMPSGPYSRQQILKAILPKTLAYIGKKGEKRAIRWSNCLRMYKISFLRQHNINLDKRFRRSQDLQLTYEATLVAQNYYYLGDDYLYHNRVVADSLSRGYTKNMWPLYKMLIERLYHVTEQFHEMDLMAQMHLRVFFFATDCIDNEFKPLCPHSWVEKNTIIKSIVEDTLCTKFNGHIPAHLLSPILRSYLSLIRSKKYRWFYIINKYYLFKNNIQSHLIMPIVNALSKIWILRKIKQKMRQ